MDSRQSEDVEERRMKKRKSPVVEESHAHAKSTFCSPITPAVQTYDISIEGKDYQQFRWNYTTKILEGLEYMTKLGAWILKCDQDQKENFELSTKLAKATRVTRKVMKEADAANHQVATLGQDLQFTEWKFTACNVCTSVSMSMLPTTLTLSCWWYEGGIMMTIVFLASLLIEHLGHHILGSRLELGSLGIIWGA
eukprot:Gb_38802 [translate_table: standard]